MYTYFLTIFTSKLNLIFFSVYFIVTLQSYFINSKIIYKDSITYKKFIYFLVINITISFIEFFIFLKIINVIGAIVLSTAIVSIITGFIRLLIYKKLIFSNFL